jgi:hypothetical protein
MGGGGRQTDTQDGDLISLQLSFMEENRLKKKKNCYAL